MNRQLASPSEPSDNYRDVTRESRRPFHTIFRRTSGLAILAALASACASPTALERNNGPDAAAPTYDELFTTYFDKGTPGHCATPGCHADPGHNVWLCMTQDSCYQGMIDIGLIDPSDPIHSSIADPKHSELTWVNSAGGTMPLDAQGDNEAGSEAIKAWVAAGAAND